MATQRSEQAFRKATARHESPKEQLVSAVESAYQVSEHEVLQNRILHSNFSILAIPRQSDAEERERIRARELTRRIERSWADLLDSGMDSGAFRREDPVLLSRVVLGAVVGVWSWYRTGGELALAEVSQTMTECCLRMVER